MYGETKPDMQCTEFELLLADALDERLGGERLGAFEAHAAACPNCGPMLAEARAGLRWLKSLEDVEPPAHLVRDIMLATVGVESARAAAAPARSWTQLAREWADTALAPLAALIRQPRFAMSFGMAFFSISLLLNAAGVRLTDLRYADLRPTAVVNTLYAAKGKVVSYYENIRFVYELETKVREFRRATSPPEAPAPKTEPKNRQDNTSGQPDRDRYRNYSRDESQMLLAFARPAVLRPTGWREL